MSVRRAVLVYDGPEEIKLEAELKKLMEKHGWEFYVAGVDLLENERDLSFFKQDDE